MDCRVCGTRMAEKTVMDEGRILESQSTCPNSCYKVEYAYGTTEVHVGSAIFYGYHADSNEEREKMNKAIEAVIEIERTYVPSNLPGRSISTNLFK